MLPVLKCPAFLQNIKQIEIKEPDKVIVGSKKMIRVGVGGTGYIGAHPKTKCYIFQYRIWNN